MKRIFTFFYSLILINSLYAQTSGTNINLIPNPGFEQYASTPIGWFYKGEHFSKVMKYWNAASAASPDVFGPKVRVPRQWAEKGFGQQKVHGGKSMIGITAYGCTNGKPHCREYVQIQLREPLVVGQNYYVQLWTSHLPRSLQINNLGVHFSEKEIALKVDALLDVSAQVYAQEILRAPNHHWIRVTGKFTATTEAEYMIIGNFFPDSLTQVRETMPDNLNFAYYYIDDVLVKKVKPFIDVPIKEDDLSQLKLKQGIIVPLKNIFFDTDKAELLPRSYVELNKLLQLLQKHPTMVIQIGGHTDSRGNANYNLELSKKRAKAVATFLNRNGIAQERTKYEGYGSKQAIHSNETEEGRQLNRRVEFLILEK